MSECSQNEEEAKNNNNDPTQDQKITKGSNVFTMNGSTALTSVDNTNQEIILTACDNNNIFISDKIT